MKRKIGFILINFILFNMFFFGAIDENFIYKLVVSSNIDKTLAQANHSSYNYRNYEISMAISFHRDILENLLKNIEIKQEEKDLIYKNIQTVLKEREFSLKNREKIYYSNEGRSRISYPFKVKNRVYFLKNTINFGKRSSGCSILLYKKGEGIDEVKDTVFNYISSWKDDIIGIMGAWKKTFPYYYILNKDFKIIKKLRHRGLIFPKDIIKRGDKIYFHKKRYKRGEPAVEVWEKGKVRYYFTRVQSLRDEIEEVAVMDDTVFSLGDKCFYISFTYPKDNFIRIYRYGDSGKVSEIKINMDEYFGVQKAWKNLDKLQRGIYDIASVNGIFEGKRYLYIAVGRNTIDRGRDTDLSDYLYVLSRDGKYYYGNIKIRYGTPVYYDRDSGYFYSVKTKNYPVKEIWRWKLAIKSRADVV